MKTLIAMVAGAALLVVGLAAQQRRPQDVDLQRAIRTETVDRDCSGAIKQYAAIVSKYRSDRATVATALIHQADCYRALGDGQARAVYERLIRDFSDQKEESAIARERLGGGTSRDKSDRGVWTGPDVDSFGRVSADGRYLTFTDWNGSGGLMLRDLHLGLNRALTAPTSTPGAYLWWSESSAISNDGKQVAYVWTYNGDTSECHLVVADLSGTGFVRPRPMSPDCYASIDWSPDDKSIAAIRLLPDGLGEIGIVSVKDGSFRVLKSAPASVFARTGGLSLTQRSRGRPTSIRVSPDGKYLAYDRRSTDTSDQRDVFVIDIATGREIPTVVHDEANDLVLGWSADSRLLFSSDRTGSVGLWGVAFRDGRAVGDPRLLKQDIGSVYSLGLTRSGALYVYRGITVREVAEAPFDLAAGTLLSPPVPVTQGFIDGRPPGNWSPDGQFSVVPLDCHDGCLAIRSGKTGEVRRIARSLTVVRAPNWAPDGQSIFILGTDRAGGQGIFQVDVRTGEATAVFMATNLSSVLAQPSPDGRKIYFNRRPDALVERDLASGAERELYRESDPEGADIRNGRLSPDGKFFVMPREVAKSASLLVIPVAGGPPREILRVTPPEKVDLPTTWMPDSSAVIVVKYTGPRSELLAIPVDGSTPRKLDINPAMWRAGAGAEGNLVLRGGDNGFNLSSDGRRITIRTSTSTAEISVLENFLPAPGK